MLAPPESLIQPNDASLLDRDRCLIGFEGIDERRRIFVFEISPKQHDYSAQAGYVPIGIVFEKFRQCLGPGICRNDQSG